MKLIDCFEIAKKLPGVKKSRYLEVGEFPIFDQSSNYIAGYSDDTNLVINQYPAVLFGDHTRVVKYINRPFVLAGDGTKILFPKKDFDPQFLYYELLNTKLPETGYNRHFKYLKDVDVQIPPLPKQKKITQILSSVDDDIQATQKVIDQTEQVKKGLMRDLFTKGISHTKFKDSELGKIPEEWEVVDFEECITNVLDFRGRTPKKLNMEWGGGTIPALSANNVRMGSIDFSKECYFGSEALYRKWMVQGDLQRGDVLMTMEAPLGNLAQVPDDQKYILSQRVVAFKSKKEFNNDYLFYLLMSPQFQSHLEQRSTGTTAKGISQKNLLGIKVVLSMNSEEQEKIARILESHDKKISVYKKKKQTLIILKKGLMQYLLSGKVRV